MSLTRKITLGIAILAILFMAIASNKMFERVDAKEIVVIQTVKGTLSAYTEPGWVWQGFGTAVVYPKSKQYWFNGKEESIPIKATFNDGADARVFGSIRWDMPIDPTAILNIHTKFGSWQAVEHQLISQVMSKTVYMTGPLMSSTESYAEKKNTLLSAIEDQAKFGVYRTHVEEKTELDPFTKQAKTVSITVVDTTASNQLARQEKSPIHEFGITLHNLAIDNIEYNDVVYTQIQKQQKAKMQVEIAITEAKQAVQNAITAEEEGKATAARAKWAQEKLKATAVTKAEQELEVAKLQKEAAEQVKQREILLGQGEAERKKLVMSADGALDKKLQTYLKAQEVWANAYAKRNVPSTVWYGSGGAGTNTDMESSQFQQMLNALIAKDLMLNPKATR